MKICFIGDSGAIHTERWVRWFARHHEVIVIATHEDAGIPEYKVATLPARALPGTRLAVSARVVREVVSRHAPDVVHSHFINEAGWFGAVSGRRPFVLTAWGSDVYRAPHESRLAARLNPWTARRANWVTADSEDQARRLRTWGVDPARLSVIGWGVDRSEFHPGVDGGPVRDQHAIPRDAPVLLSPRQWYPNSNIEAVVAAHAAMDPRVYLILKRTRGYEPDGGEAVERALGASRARDRIRVVERLEASALPALYAASDVVISLCTTDGTPVSVLEAMATGRPVVALENASLAEWVSDPGGRLVRGLDPQAIARAVEAVLAPAARGSALQHNVRVVADRADRDVEFGRMAAIYERLLTEAGRG